MNINWRPKDEQLSRFIDRYVDSFASWDLILFMHYNPDTADTAEGFAGRLGRSADEVGRALEHFCCLGTVSSKGGAGEEVFYPKLDGETREDFAKFVHAQDDRELRLMLIRSILHKNRE